MPLDRGMTLTEKILLQHAVGWTGGSVRAGDTLRIAVDWTLASEIAWSGMDRTYNALGRPPLFDKDRFYLALDHTVDRATLAGDPRVQRLVKLSRGFAREASLRYFYDANVTIMHTEFFRQLVLPGDVVLGADSHTSSHGGMAAFAIGLGGADVVAAMVEGSSWLQVPEAIRVHYAGRLPFGLTGKDVVLRTLGQLGRNTVAMERTVEYTGDFLDDLSTDFRFTIANMTAELGGLNGIFPADGRVRQALLGRRDPAFRDGGVWLRADEDAEYVDTFTIALTDLAPQVAKPYSPDNVTDVGRAAGQSLDGCFIGACTTTEEELILGALVLERALAGRGSPLTPGKRRVVPGNQEITERLERTGLLEVYRRGGFEIGEPGCSMCIGIASDRAAPGEVWLSSQNRNFPNRMGQGSIAWLASALTVAASALDMRIADPRPYLEGLDGDRAASLLSSRDGLPPVIYSEPEPRRAAAQTPRGAGSSQRSGVIRGRAQLFGDHVDTDAMIAAEFCHLTDLGELGARAFLHFRPEFVGRVQAGEDILVAGEGWGTGSSREHAVWALKGAGVRAVVAKSFAYIHKRNLVNEALPFLVVRDEAFYEAVRDGEAVEIDLAAATVTVGGCLFAGIALPAALTEVIAHGGLVPLVESHLRSSAFASIALGPRDDLEPGGGADSQRRAA
jgi:3-isopropylmalate dehydratase small subunit